VRPAHWGVSWSHILTEKKIKEKGFCNPLKNSSHRQMTSDEKGKTCKDL